MVTQVNLSKWQLDQYNLILKNKYLLKKTATLRAIFVFISELSQVHLYILLIVLMRYNSEKFFLHILLYGINSYIHVKIAHFYDVA